MLVLRTPPTKYHNSFPWQKIAQRFIVCFNENKYLKDIKKLSVKHGIANHAHKYRGAQTFKMDYFSVLLFFLLGYLKRVQISSLLLWWGYWALTGHLVNQLLYNEWVSTTSGIRALPHPQNHCWVRVPVTSTHCWKWILKSLYFDLQGKLFFSWDYNIFNNSVPWNANYLFLIIFCHLIAF